MFNRIQGSKLLLLFLICFLICWIKFCKDILTSMKNVNTIKSLNKLALFEKAGVICHVFRLNTNGCFSRFVLMSLWWLRLELFLKCSYFQPKTEARCSYKIYINRFKLLGHFVKTVFDETTVSDLKKKCFT